MSHREPTPLVIAVRVFPDLKDENRNFDKPQRERHRPDAMFVFDTETRTDRTQRLTFGSYRFIIGGQLAKENLFYGDNLPTKDLRILERYVATPRTVVPGEPAHDTSLLTRDQFVARVFKNAYKGRCLLIAFNFPFDISRVACNFANARGRFAGGFSLDLWSYLEGRNRFRPSVCIKHIDSKRALKRFYPQKRSRRRRSDPRGFNDRPTRGRLRFSWSLPRLTHAGVCAYRQELHARKSLRRLRRRTRKTARDTAWHRHAKLHQIQPPRRSRHLGTSR
jgi:hypothetical protein